MGKSQKCRARLGEVPVFGSDSEVVPQRSRTSLCRLGLSSNLTAHQISTASPSFIQHVSSLEMFHHIEVRCQLVASKDASEQQFRLSDCDGCAWANRVSRGRWTWPAASGMLDNDQSRSSESTMVVPSTTRITEAYQG
jgi:hypothetical protein